MRFSNRGGVVIALPLLFLALAAEDQKPPSVDDIIARSIEARGGMAKIKGLQTMQMTGTAQLNGQLQASVRIFNKRPNLTRFEMNLEGMTIVQGFDGTTAWFLNPLMTGGKAKASPESQSKEFRAHTDMDGLLVDYKAKGRAVTLDGSEDIGGSPAWKLKVTEKDGGADYVYLDKKSYLMVKSTSEHIGSTILFSNYQPVDGLMMPFRVEQSSAAGGGMVMTLDNIQTNIPLDDAQFRMPADTPAQ